jgi:hypothetical protein
VISFEHRGNDRPFEVAGKRLGREIGARHSSLDAVSHLRPQVGPRPPGQAAPVRQPLPADLAKALAAASGVAPANGATSPPSAATLRPPPTTNQKDSSTDRGR